MGVDANYKIKVGSDAEGNPEVSYFALFNIQPDEIKVKETHVLQEDGTWTVKPGYTLKIDNSRYDEILKKPIVEV